MEKKISRSTALFESDEFLSFAHLFTTS